ncbi:MAG TPA: preprotein translocase subunit YajC [Propionibacteriaceae bacterium]|jgi:preprotein translocase subunit YajC|nr:preprotein translocase subunit YajC [Propionibacteriaceae bacterium]
MQQYSTFIFIALLVVAFYFLILRPQRKRQQALQQTMNAISPGSRVMLGSGLFGTVVAVGPRQVVLEISPGAEVTVLKQAISKVVTDEDEDNLDEQDELDEEETATEQPIELPRERPIEEPTAATSSEPAAEPDSSPTPRDSSTTARDSKPPIAD